jgi:hypothetical protein
MRVTEVVLLVVGAAACVSPPRPAPQTLALKRNAAAVVEGRVVDTHGTPVVDLRVDAIPRGAEIPWSRPAMTAPDGRFRLELFAPGQYSFALRRGEQTVVTDDPRDPSRVHITVEPGGHTDGIELLFLQEEWEKILAQGAVNNI